MRLGKIKRINKKRTLEKRLIACQRKWKLITWITEIKSYWFVFQNWINMSEGMVQPFGQILGNVYYVNTGAMRISTNKLGKCSVIDHVGHHVCGKEVKASQTKILKYYLQQLNTGE